MTTYSEFRSYYLREIWREGDTALEEDLPRLMKKAEARISRDLRQHDITGIFEGSISSGNSIQLPGDFQEVSSLSINGSPTATPVSMDQLELVRRHPRVSRAHVYAIYGGAIHLPATAYGSAPITVSMKYQTGLVPYETEPVNPFYDRHPDFYIAALNIYVYNYLRDFDLAGKNDNDYGVLLDSMERASNYAKWPSGQLDYFPASLQKSSSGFPPADPEAGLGDPGEPVYDES